MNTSIGAILSVLFLCSCATAPHSSEIVPATGLPAEATINRSAGRGGMLFVTLRLEDGEELPFGVDTGSEGTIFDKSLAPKLGRRLGTKTLSGWHGKTESDLYAAPILYLGKVRLMTGHEVATADFQRQSLMTGHPVMGILGMDCLRNYCVQLDFESGIMRFPSPGQMDAAELGNGYRLTFKHNCPFIHHAAFAGGTNAEMLIDSGCVSDGLVETDTSGGRESGMTHLRECAWAGHTYTNLHFYVGGCAIGLKFLARHLVTLDFPQRTMYLSRRSTGPLIDEDVEAATTLLQGLKAKGLLPGWSKDERGETGYPVANPNAVTFSIWKESDSSIYRYTVSRQSNDAPWKLQRAWRTDQTGKTIEEFTLP